MGMPNAPGGGGMGGGLGSMLGGPEAEARLRAHPRIGKYFQDPKFNNMWLMCQQNPQMLMQMIQTDPRFMDVFKELTGVDLMDLQEKQMKEKDKAEELKKKREAEEKAKKEAEEKKKKEDQEMSLPEEERTKLQLKKEAEALKTQGNEFYKQKKFEDALNYYQ